MKTKYGNEVIFTSYTDLCVWMENNGTPHEIFAGDVKVPKKDICCVCGKELGIEDECYEDSISDGSLCDGHAVYVEAEDVYVPDFDILIEKAVEEYDNSEDFWHGTTHYDVNIFEKNGELWASVYQVKDKQTDVCKVLCSKKIATTNTK